MHCVEILLGGCFVWVLGIACTDSSVQRGCPQGWVQYSKSCFKIFADRQLNWYFAEEMCRMMGGHLVEPNSQQESQFIQYMAQKSNVSIWYARPGYQAAMRGCSNPDDYTNPCLRMLLPRDLGSDSNGCQSLFHAVCERSAHQPTALLRCYAVTTGGASQNSTGEPLCLFNHTYKEVVIAKPVQCCKLCSRDAECRSFNLRGESQCQLNSATVSQAPSSDYMTHMHCQNYEYKSTTE